MVEQWVFYSLIATLSAFAKSDIFLQMPTNDDVEMTELENAFLALPVSTNEIIEDQMRQSQMRREKARQELQKTFFSRFGRSICCF